MGRTLDRRTFLKKAGQLGGLTLAGGALGSVLPACRSIGNAGLLMPGVLQWGSSADGGAPYAFYDPANPDVLVGFEVEIAAAIAGLMSVMSKEVDGKYDELDASLQAGKFDLILSGWEKTAAHDQDDIYSQP